MRGTIQTIAPMRFLSRNVTSVKYDKQCRMTWANMRHQHTGISMLVEMDTLGFAISQTIICIQGGHSQTSREARFHAHIRPLYDFLLRHIIKRIQSSYTVHHGIMLAINALKPYIVAVPAHMGSDVLLSICIPAS